MKKFNLLIPIFLLLLAGSTAIAQNANTAVRAGNRPSDIPIEEPPANSTVRGRVFYENTGRPVRRAPIMLMSKDGGGPREASGLTDGNGYFEIKKVAAGTYYAMVNAPGVVTPLGYADLSQPQRDGMDEAVKNFQPIYVNGINDVEVQVAAKQGGAIAGRITYSDGYPAIGVKVEVLRRVEDRFLPVIPNLSSIFSMFSGGGGGFQTDDRGVYRFSGLPAGEYIVKVSESVSHSDNKAPGYSPFEEIFLGTSSLLTLYYPDVFETEKAQIINVTEGQEMYEINITIPDRELYRIEGKVISAKDKSPLKGTKIVIKTQDDKTVSLFNQLGRGQQNSLTDETGNWNFKELPKGTYQLIIEPNNDEYGPYEEDGDYPLNSNSYKTNRPAGPKPPKFAKKIQEITITDKNISELVIELGYGANISGTVVTENSKEMPENVYISVNDKSEELRTSTSISNYSNPFEPKPQKPEHNFKLENAPEGKLIFNVSVQDEDFYVKSATLNNTDILSQPLELKDGDDLKNVRIVLAKDVGTVKGKVIDGNRQPAANKKFALVPVSAARRRTTSFYRFITSDENGEFTIKAAPAEYAVVIFDKRHVADNSESFYTWLDEVIKDAQKVTVKAGETSTATFTIP